LLFTLYSVFNIFTLDSGLAKGDAERKLTTYEKVRKIFLIVMLVLLAILVLIMAIALFVIGSGSTGNKEVDAMGRSALLFAFIIVLVAIGLEVFVLCTMLF
jgi:hypothetical protein